jgi:DnaJ-class molecular chaperone
MVGETHFDILGVSQDATQKAIKRAFHEIARVCHPDVVGDDAAARARFEAASRAYEVLSSPDARERYVRSIALPETVEGVLTRHHRGLAIVMSAIPTAKAEPKPGVHLAQLARAGEVPAGVSRKLRWARVAGAGAEGANGAEPGDLFVIRGA